ncbi:MAG TPA: type II secretion system protein [Gemmatimonadaceae bacterium]|nr:type II secretion system protein [Gemmatimonadaceae bacterium]
MPRRRAFTILELLFVIVTIGVLAAISISHFVETRFSAREKEVTGALAGMARAQEGYRAAHGRYAATPAELGYTLPTGITATIGGAGLSSGTGWSAVAQHEGAPGLRCTIGIGADTVVEGRAVKPGVATCRRESGRPE